MQEKWKDSCMKKLTEGRNNIWNVVGGEEN